MGRTFGRELILQVDDLQAAAAFYREQLGFAVEAESAELLCLAGDEVNLYLERGPALGPVLEVFVADVAVARERLLAQGCEVVREEPGRCYLRDPFGLMYNLARG